MKLKALLLALAVAGAGASFALADDSTGGTTTTGATTTTTTTTTSTTTATSDGCRRFELKGTLASVSATSFTVAVTKGSKAAKPAVGTTVTVAVGADTRVSWSGRGTFTGPNVGDSVKVNGKQCGTTLTASKVAARGASKHPEGSHADAAAAAKHGEKSGHGDKSESHGKKSHK
jgi:hypothetical protein